MKKSVAISFALASFVCWLLVVVSLATPVWQKSTLYLVVKKTVATYGLFQNCQLNFGVWVCFSIPYSSDSVQAVRAFLIMAAILLFSQIIYCWIVAIKKALCWGIAIMFLVAGIFILIAMATYTAQVSNVSSKSYGYSYYLGWVSMIATLILTVLSAVMARVSDYVVLA